MSTTVISLSGSNGTLLTSFVPSVGGGFSALSTSTTSAFNATGRLKWAGPVSYTVSQYAYTVGVSAADYTVSSTFRFTNTVGSVIADTMCIRARSSNANREGYLLTFGGIQAQLFKVDSAGSITAIGTAVTYASVGLGASTLDTDYIGTLTVNGTTISATFRGVSLFSRTDSTLSSAGYAGIGGNSGSSLGSGIEISEIIIETLGDVASINSARIFKTSITEKSQVQVHDASMISTHPMYRSIVIRPN